MRRYDRLQKRNFTKSGCCDEATFVKAKLKKKINFDSLFKSFGCRIGHILIVTS